jgi:hypothetical protein
MDSFPYAMVAVMVTVIMLAMLLPGTRKPLGTQAQVCNIHRFIRKLCEFKA